VKLFVKNLTVERAGEAVVDNLAFQVEAGKAVFITGENGAGKSTALRAIAGLMPLAKGHVYLEDETGRRFGEPVREYCHYLGHKNGMKAALSVWENLKFWQDFYGDPVMEIHAALAIVELEHTADLPFHYLSAGQKRRAAIARLIASDRPVWILDEPTSGLDEASVRRFAQIAQTHCQEGGIVIAATHLDLGFPSSQNLHLEPTV